MLSTLFSLLSIAVTVSVGFDSVRIEKNCNSYDISNFDSLNYTQFTQKFQGKWYVVGKYGQAEYCSADLITYFPNSNITTLTHLNRSENNNEYNLTHFVVNNEFKLERGGMNETMNITILPHNETYITMWSCVDIISSNSSDQTLIVLNREKKAIDKFNMTLINATGTITGNEFKKITCPKISIGNNTKNNTTSNANITKYHFLLFLLFYIVINFTPK